MASLNLKSTVLLGYVDVNAAGCRTLLGVDPNKFVSSPWHLRTLDNDNRTKFGSISVGNELLPNAQIFTHNDLEVSILILNTAIPDDISHAVANEIVETFSNCNLKQIVILSSFPVNDIQTCISISNTDIADRHASSRLRCSDTVLNSLIQFLIVEKLPFTIYIADGRKIRWRTYPNLDDGSQQCIENFNETINRKLNLGLQIGYSLAIKYEGITFEDDSTNLMYL